MNTKQITTEGGIVLLLDLPEGANRLKIFNDERPYLSYFVNTDTFREYLPEGNWQGKHFKEMREEECGSPCEESSGLVDFSEMAHYGIDDHEGGYKCYIRGYWHHKTAKYSLASLIRSNGFDPENTLVLTLKD